MRPRSRTTTRSASWRASARSCVTRRWTATGSLAELPQQFHDRRLHGDVERARRFVEENQAGMSDHGTSHRDALPLSAREGTRQAPGLVWSDPDLLECRVRTGAVLPPCEEAMDMKRIGDNVGDDPAIVQGLPRILGDESDVPPPLPPLACRSSMSIDGTFVEQMADHA